MKLFNFINPLWLLKKLTFTIQYQEGDVYDVNGQSVTTLGGYTLDETPSTSQTAPTQNYFTGSGVPWYNNSNNNNQNYGSQSSGNYQGALAPTGNSQYQYNTPAVYNPQADQSFWQNSASEQYSQDWQQQQSSSLNNTQAGSAFNELNKKYNLSETYGQEFQQAWEQAMSQSLGTSQSLNQMQVSDPIGYYNLVMSELAGTSGNTEAGYQALQNILYGATPEFDAQQYQDLQKTAIGQAIATAMSGPQAHGMGETDQDRQAAFAAEAAGVPIAQMSLDAQKEYDFQNLAASIQAADSLASSRGDLVEGLMPTLTSLFGETTSGETIEQQQQLSQMESMATNTMYQQQIAEEIAERIGTSSEWSQEQIDSFSTALSATLATSLGSIFGKSAESGGGKWICSVCVAHGHIDLRLLVKELATIQLNPMLFQKARKGYDIWGIAVARWLSDKPRISKIIAPFARTFMEYITGERNLRHRIMFHSVVKFSELFAK